MELCTVVVPTLQFELHCACLQRLVGQRERALPGCGCHRRYVGIDGEATAFPHHYHQQRIRGVLAQRSRYRCPGVSQQVVSFKRRPLPLVVVVADPYHAQRGNAERRDSPDRLVARPVARAPLAPPLLLHGTPTAASARRCRALPNLSWSARSISRCISSALSVCPWDTAKWTFSRIVRRAKTSARTVCSPALGLVAFSRISRAHSLIVCPPARASNWAYSSSVTLVLMDLVRREGMEFTPMNSTSSHTGTKSCCAAL